ncbi:MAG TPA: HD domain-containing phosphohydrolase [Actinomycetota bacterium]
MNGGYPTPQAAEEGRALLRAMSAVQQTFRLYPDRHPNRLEAVRDLVERSHRLVDAVGEPAVIFIARGSFYLGPALLAHESIALSTLRRAFESAEIQAIEIFARVTDEDVDQLCQMLVAGQEGEELPMFTGLMLNRVVPSLPGEDQRQREVSELFQSYASGLELLRQAAAQVMTGDKVDLASTRAIVEHLADQIAKDPVQALLVTTVKSYDEYTYYHMVNVAMLSIALGYAVGLEREQVILLGLGGLLHDVGKMKVSKEVLDHPGKLSEEQWRAIQRHPVDGAGLVFVTSRDLLHPAASIVLEHHSAYDLSGYPSLSRRPHPSLPARLISVADCFDAVTSNRSYRKAEDRQRALGILEAGSGKGYDGRLVRAFTRLMGVIPIGSLVRLSTGELGLVVRNHETDPTTPVVRLLLDKTETPQEPEEVDLAALGPNGEPWRSVVEVVEPDVLGVDMAALLQEGHLGSAQPLPEVEEGEGLVHEPGHGEEQPEGYVDTHAEADQHGHDHNDLPPVDDQVAPPFVDSL